MREKVFKHLEEQYAERRAAMPEFKAGDSVNVHVRITEGNKERVQVYKGVVMSRNNAGSNGETFTVRKISGTIAVERIFPLLSPGIDKIEVIRRGSVRRAKLYYLRGRKGKAARIKEKLTIKKK